MLNLTARCKQYAIKSMIDIENLNLKKLYEIVCNKQIWFMKVTKATAVTFWLTGIRGLNYVCMFRLYIINAYKLLQITEHY